MQRVSNCTASVRPPPWCWCRRLPRRRAGNPLRRAQLSLNGRRQARRHHISRPQVLTARLIRTGEVIELGHVLRAGMPIQATRRFDLHTKRTFMNPQSNQRGSNEEVVTTELGQVGTQFDGFAHQSHGDSLYNCFKISDVATRTGFTKLGIEKVGTLMTRGVLIDVAGLKGVDTLPDTYEITVQDLQQALQSKP